MTPASNLNDMKYEVYYGAIKQTTTAICSDIKFYTEIKLNIRHKTLLIGWKKKLTGNIILKWFLHWHNNAEFMKKKMWQNLYYK